MAEPPWDDPAPPVRPQAGPPAPRRATPPPRPDRPEVTRADLKRLVEERFPPGKWVRDDQWEGCCPVHEDHSPSFGAGLRPNPKARESDAWMLLISCRVCEDGPAYVKEACARVGIEVGDLFTRPAGPGAALARRVVKNREGLELVSEHPYTDEDGKLLFRVSRWEGVVDGKRKKTFTRSQPGPDGKWISNAQGVRPVLYNLPMVRAAVAGMRTVWYVEGEKNADALTRASQTATTHASGAGQWKNEYGPQLQGVAELVIVEDNDEPGRAGAAKVAAGAAPFVGRVVRLDLRNYWPGVPEAGDASDVLAHFGVLEGVKKLFEWAERAKSEPPVLDAEIVAPVELAGPPALAPTGNSAALDWRDPSKTWEELLETTVIKGQPAIVLCPYNVALILDRHPLFAGRIRYDQMKNRIRFKRPDWWQPPITDHIWTTDDTTFFRQWCDKTLRLTAKTTKGDEILGPGTHFDKVMVQEAVLSVGVWNKVHPLRDWLNSLVWDGQKRLCAWLVKHCNAAFGRYSEVVGTAWMVSAVARVMSPGCQVDHMLVLRGEQGAGKTGLFRLLGGPYYGSMQGVDLRQKDAKQHLIGKWIMEFAELEGMNRHDLSTVKAYLTDTVDDFRKPYAAESEEFPRQVVFGGTINEESFLRDDTGNRRFWIVECGSDPIDLSRLALERDQLFAEAVARYRLYVAAVEANDEAKKKEYQWWLTPEDEALAREVQRANLIVGQDDDKLTDWLNSDRREPGTMLFEATTIDGQPHITVEQAVKYGLQRESRPSDSILVSGALRRAGWYRNRRRPPGAPRRVGPRWYWHPDRYENTIFPPGADGRDS